MTRETKGLTSVQGGCFLSSAVNFSRHHHCCNYRPEALSYGDRVTLMDDDDGMDGCRRCAVRVEQTPACRNEPWGHS